MPASKLTAEQIAALRAEAPAAGRGYSSRKARELGVSRNSVWQIINYQRHAGRPLPADFEFDPRSYRARILAKLGNGNEAVAL